MTPKLIDKLPAEHGYRPQDIGGENGLLKQLTKALLERAMQAELSSDPGYEKHDPAGLQDRELTEWQEPKIVGKHQTRWTGFDDKILSMYWERQRVKLKVI